MAVVGLAKRVGGLHDDEGRAGDEALGFQQPIDAGFRDEGSLAIGEGDRHFARGSAPAGRGRTR